MFLTFARGMFADVAPSKSELPKKVVEYLRGEKKALLEKLMEDKTGRIAVKFLDYDWSSNDANFDPHKDQKDCCSSLQFSH